MSRRGGGRVSPGLDSGCSPSGRSYLLDHEPRPVLEFLTAAGRVVGSTEQPARSLNVTRRMIGDALTEWPLFGYADDVRPLLAQARKTGQPAALATIIGLSGGGLLMAAQIAFAVGEAIRISIRRLSGIGRGRPCRQEVTADGSPRWLIYGEGSPWPDIRLMCGARMVILLERIAPDDAAVATLLDLAETRTPAIWLSDGERRACGPADAAPAVWPGAFQRRYRPAPRLVVLGGDPTALAIASLGAQAGWETTLDQGRSGRRRSPASPTAARKRPRLSPTSASIRGPPSPPPPTTPSLTTRPSSPAPPSSAFYVGALGARRRRASEGGAAARGRS